MASPALTPYPHGRVSNLTSIDGTIGMTNPQGEIVDLSARGGANSLIGITTTSEPDVNRTVPTLTALGMGAGDAVTGGDNTAIGVNALTTNTTGDDNTAIGVDALGATTTGGFNSALGDGALMANSTGGWNSAVGLSALGANTTGDHNTVIGANALLANTVGNYNSAVGYGALLANTAAEYNSAVGSYALTANTTGGNNNAVGHNAMALNTTGSNNSAVGENALHANTVQNYATGLGANTVATANGAVAIGVDNTGAGATTAVANEIALGTALHTTKLLGTPAFVAADVYLVIDAAGHIHKSGLGPVS